MQNGTFKTAVHLKSPGSYFEDWKLSSNQLCGERDIRITDPCVLDKEISYLCI